MTTLEHDTPEWHAARAAGIGASDIAAILGLNPWQSAWALWAEKTGLIARQEPSNPERLRIGHLMEDVLAAVFTERTGLRVVDRQRMVEHPDNPVFRATLDGIAVSFEEGEGPADLFAVPVGIVEFKTTADFGGWDEELPAMYRAQVVWQMGVSGIRHAFVVVMYAGFKVDIIEVPWDERAEADWQYMTMQATEWWQHVVDGTPPPVDGSDATAAAIRTLHPVHDPGTTIDAGPDLVAALADHARLTAEIKTLTEQADTVKNFIAAAIGDAETVLVDGTPAATYKAQTRTNVDMKAMAAAGVDLGPYTTTTTYRVLRTTTKKEKP